MFKLRLDGTTVRVTDPFMHIDWDIHEEFKHSKLCLNMDAFFDKADFFANEFIQQF